jgi:hypothetical protein
LDYNGLTDDDLNIDFCQEAMEAEIFSDKFTEKFSNLIK